MAVSKKTQTAPNADATPAASTESTQAARDYAIRAASAVLERASAVHAGAEKVTHTIETAATGSVAGLAKVSREIQTAMFDDAKAAIAAFETVVSSKSIGDAFRAHADYLRAQNDVNIARAKTVGGLVSGAVKTGVQTAQDNLAKLGVNYSKAA